MSNFHPNKNKHCLFASAKRSLRNSSERGRLDGRYLKIPIHKWFWLFFSKFSTLNTSVWVAYCNSLGEDYYYTSSTSYQVDKKYLCNQVRRVVFTFIYWEYIDCMEQFYREFWKPQYCTFGLLFVEWNTQNVFKSVYKTQVWLRGHTCLLDMRINFNFQALSVADPQMNSKKHLINMLDFFEITLML